MDKIVIAFAILVGFLIFGIFILIKPHIFVFQTSQNQNAADSTLAEDLMPRVIIVSGAAFIIMGIVGLSVLGFRIYKELFIESNSKK